MAPPPVKGDPAHLPAGTAVRLPATLTEASAAFAASGLLRDAFGELLHGAADAWWPLVGGVA
ncbi:MAG: hypothetical protein ACKOFN_02060 [Vulcanococcus sp.]